jgi:drug/metabolite transporter (DMT)-like permease
MTTFKSAAMSRTVGPGIVLVLLTVLVSGVSNFVNFKAVQGTNVDAWIAVRNAVVALLLMPMVLLVGPGIRRRLSRTDWTRLMMIGLIGGAIPFLLYFHGFQMALGQGGAAAASLGYRSLFLMATVLGVLFLKERIPRRFAIGAGLVMVGNVLLLSFSGPIWTDGTVYVLLATAMWAGEYTMSKRLLGTLPSGTVAASRMGFGALFLLAYLGLTGQASSITGFGGSDWITLFYSALLLFAFVSTWYAGLKTVDLTVASSLLVLAFPVTWILGVITAGRGFTMGQVVGATAIVAGIGLAVGIALQRRLWVTLVVWVRSQIARME